MSARRVCSLTDTLLNGAQHEHNNVFPQKKDVSVRVSLLFAFLCDFRTSRQEKGVTPVTRKGQTYASKCSSTVHLLLILCATPLLRHLPSLTNRFEVSANLSTVGSTQSLHAAADGSLLEKSLDTLTSSSAAPRCSHLNVSPHKRAAAKMTNHSITCKSIRLHVDMTRAWVMSLLGSMHGAHESPYRTPISDHQMRRR